MKYLILLFALISPLAHADLYDDLHQECVEYNNEQMLNIEGSEILKWMLERQNQYGTDAALEMGKLMNIIQCKNEQQKQMIQMLTIKAGTAI